MRRRPATNAGPADTSSPGMNIPRGLVDFCCDFCKQSSLKQIIFQDSGPLISSCGYSHFLLTNLISWQKLMIICFFSASYKSWSLSKNANPCGFTWSLQTSLRFIAEGPFCRPSSHCLANRQAAGRPRRFSLILHFKLTTYGKKNASWYLPDTPIGI